MKLVTYRYKSVEKIGVLESDKVYEIINYKSMLELIQGGAELQLSEESIELNQIELLSPIPRPIRNIICLGKNYMEHCTEMGKKISNFESTPPYPIYFSKMADMIIGDKMEIVSYSDLSKTLDYEVELAVIIGKRGKNISKEEARDYIFGYSIANDITMRELQKNHYQWLKGKSLDTHMALGPVILTADEVEYPPSLEIKLYVNDELRQSSTTDLLIYDLDYIISDLSKGITLVPGDIILTGTPGGVGMGHTPPVFLVPGDVVKCEIEKIGELVNYIK